MIYLPASNGKSSVEPVASEEQKNLKGNETILVVEDEVAVSDLVVRALEQYGYTVFQAANGSEALELVQKIDTAVDLVITDVVMPRMGGVELAHALTDIWPDVPILFISGYNEELTLARGELRQLNAYLQKPFRPAALLRMVRDMLPD